MGFRRAGGNDSDHFFIVVLKPCMDNQKHCALTDGSNSYPPLFLSISLIALREGTRIAENQGRGFKADIVLTEILPVLVLVPLKPHGWLSVITRLSAPAFNVNTNVRTYLTHG